MDSSALSSFCCVLTIETPWHWIRRNDDRPRAFWARQPELIFPQLARLAAPLAQAPHANALANLPGLTSDNVILRLSHRAPLSSIIASLLTQAVFSSESDDGLSPREKSQVSLVSRPDCHPFPAGLLVGRCMSSVETQTAAFDRLIIELGLSMDLLVELPVSPDEGSLVGASCELWRDAILSFEEKSALLASSGDRSTRRAPKAGRRI